MASSLSMSSLDSGVFYVEQSSNDQNLPKPNTPSVLNSAEMSGNDIREMISISSIASQIVTIGSDSNQPTMPYVFGRQLPISPPGLNHLNLPPKTIQRPPGNHGGSELYRRWVQWELQPTVTGAFRTVTDIDAPDERQHNRRMGDASHEDGRQYILLWWLAAENFFAINSYPTAATPKAEKEIEPRNVLPKKRGSVAARLRGLWTRVPWAGGHTKLVDNKLKIQDWKTLFKHLTHQFIFRTRTSYVSILYTHM